MTATRVDRGCRSIERASRERRHAERFEVAFTRHAWIGFERSRRRRGVGAQT